MRDIETTIPKVFIVLSIMNPGIIDTSSFESYITKPIVNKQENYYQSFSHGSISRYSDVNQFDKTEGEIPV